MEHGSHAVFVGLVRAVEVTSNDVLIYHDGKYLRASALSQL
jgi:flavin reductase (DIM6/NTAB) family NADH-FMN oxidoreductase RutF